MNEALERNNLYFMYINCEKEYRYILIKKDDEFCEFFSNTYVGAKDDLFDEDELVIAPIDLILFHNLKLEYLNRDYSPQEQELLLNKSIQSNPYRKLKYTFNKDEIEGIYNILSSMSIEELNWIVQKYDSYFKNRKVDPVLRIYTN